MTGVSLQAALRKYTRAGYYGLSLLALIIFIVMTAAKATQPAWFYSYDPFYHYNITLHWEFTHPFSNGIPGLGGKLLAFDYPTLFRSWTAIVASATGLSLRLVYQLTGILLHGLASLYMFIIVRKLTKREGLAFLALAAFLFTPYLFYRSLISYPENEVLVFHLMIIYELIKTLDIGRPTKLLFVATGISLLVHYRSIIVPAVAIAYVFVLQGYRAFHEKRLLTFIKGWAAGFLIVAAVSIPVSINVVRQYLSYATSNVGANASLKGLFENTTQYLPFDYQGYQDQMGIVLVSLVTLSAALVLVGLFKKRIDFPKSSMFLIMSLFTFALTRGQELKLYIPPIRMFSYFAIFAIPLVCIALMMVERRLTMNARFIVTGVFAVTLLYQALGVTGWVGLNQQDLDFGSQLNRRLSPDSVIVWDTYNPVVIGVDKYNLIEPSWLQNQALVGQQKPDKGELLRTYPRKQVVIITGAELSGFQEILSSPDIHAYSVGPGNQQ